MAEQPAGVNPQQKSQMLFMMIGLGAMLLIMIYNEPVGGLMNTFMGPVFGFSGKYVVPTLMLTGMLMIGLSTILRTLMTDTIKQTKSQKEMSAFNQELRKARMENNLYKIKKLTEQQSAMMSKSMESSMTMMKTLPLTMIIIMPMFAWINYYIGNIAIETIIAVPWADTVYLTGEHSKLWFLPIWVMVYMLVTIPFAQILGRLIRWFKFKKRLQQIESGIVS